MTIKISGTSGSSERFLTGEISKPLTVTFAIAKKISGLGLTTLWIWPRKGAFKLFA